MPAWPTWTTAALWAGFIVYWSAAAANSAQTLRSESVKSRQVHQILMWGSLLLTLLPWFWALRWRWLPPAVIYPAIGLGVQVASALLAVWARRHLGRNWSGAITTKADHQLVQTGPYRWLRHPIYTGMLGMFLGSALVWGELHALLGLALITLAYARKIRLEERSLREVFGGAYDRYCESSWALIPGLV
jgi:protein-S-isoprenylcysteine O-methyltransferase Ste14